MSVYLCNIIYTNKSKALKPCSIFIIYMLIVYSASDMSVISGSSPNDTVI